MSAKDYFKEGFRAFGSKLKEVFITIPREFFKGNWNKLKERRRLLLNRHGRFGLISKRLLLIFIIPVLIFQGVLLIVGASTPEGIDTANFQDPIWIFWTLIAVGIYLGIMIIFFIILQFIVYGEKKDKHGLVETNDN